MVKHPVAVLNTKVASKSLTDFVTDRDAPDSADFVMFVCTNAEIIRSDGRDIGIDFCSEPAGFATFNGVAGFERVV